MTKQRKIEAERDAQGKWYVVIDGRRHDCATAGEARALAKAQRAKLAATVP